MQRRYSRWYLLIKPFRSWSFLNAVSTSHVIITGKNLARRVSKLSHRWQACDARCASHSQQSERVRAGQEGKPKQTKYTATAAITAVVDDSSIRHQPAIETHAIDRVLIHFAAATQSSSPPPSPRTVSRPYNRRRESLRAFIDCTTVSRFRYAAGSEYHIPG